MNTEMFFSHSSRSFDKLTLIKMSYFKHIPQFFSPLVFKQFSKRSYLKNIFIFIVYIYHTQMFPNKCLQCFRHCAAGMQMIGTNYFRSAALFLSPHLHDYFKVLSLDYWKAAL